MYYAINYDFLNTNVNTNVVELNANIPKKDSTTLL